jgi:hypothetical protein
MCITTRGEADVDEARVGETKLETGNWKLGKKRSSESLSLPLT